jgi:radical SAM protein (TIGR01212 family)
MQEILTAGRYFRKIFGCNVYKTPISILGFTCPNIDGSVAYGGCVFCENESFSPNLGVQKIKKNFSLSPKSKENPFLQAQLTQLESQYKQTKKILEKKFDAKKFLVYFQSFTNTYAPFSTLKALYERAFELEDVIGLSIGTRSDSIEKQTLEYLSEKSKTHEIWVEYGIQSVYDTTLDRINRGHSVQNVFDYITLTRQYGIKVCAHLIFGLPGETQEMMLQSVQAAIDLGVESIKIHPLYVVKRTALANDFNKGSFIPISEEEYIDTLVKALKMIPKEMMVQRVSAGISDDSLLSPSWCYNKHKQMYNIKKALKENKLIY